MTRIVVKVGTSSVTDERGGIDDGAIAKLSADVAEVRATGAQVVVVSSGAVAAGVAALGLESRPGDVATLQALAAAGQPRLMRSWDAALGTHGLVPAQALLVPHDFVDRRQYLHARRTLTRLLELGTVPIINENDAIASNESRYGDNDRLAALIAHNIGAAVLVLLTDLDGLYTTDPRADPTAALVSRVGADDPLLAIRAGRTGSDRGSGGMASKLEAARIASWSGVRTVIANAARPGVLAGAVADEAVGTSFAAHRRKLAARKLWIAFAARVAGSVTVDDGRARRWSSATPACSRRASSTSPAASARATPSTSSASTGSRSRGMVFVEAAQLRKVAGRHTTDLPPGMVHEVIHRDDLVLLPG